MTTHQTADLADWLIERIAFYLDRPIDSIDPTVDLAVYGMDSLYTLSVISDVEDHLDLDIDAATLRDYPTLNELVDYLLELQSTGIDGDEQDS
jgi:acyl carrier protein